MKGKGCHGCSGYPAELGADPWPGRVDRKPAVGCWKSELKLQRGLHRKYGCGSQPREGKVRNQEMGEITQGSNKVKGEQGVLETESLMGLREVGGMISEELQGLEGGSENSSQSEKGDLSFARRGV